jgi:hypothetical protein
MANLIGTLTHWLHPLLDPTPTFSPTFTSNLALKHPSLFNNHSPSSFCFYIYPESRSWLQCQTAATMYWAASRSSSTTGEPSPLHTGQPSRIPRPVGRHPTRTSYPKSKCILCGVRAPSTPPRVVSGASYESDVKLFRQQKETGGRRVPSAPSTPTWRAVPHLPTSKAPAGPGGSSSLPSLKVLSPRGTRVLRLR